MNDFIKDVFRMTNPSERSNQIMQEVVERFIKTTKQSEDKSKNDNALNIVRPKIKHLIDQDES